MGRKVVLVEVDRLVAVCNPFDPVWDTPDIRRMRITRRQVAKCMREGKLEAAHFNSAGDAKSWTLERHARRVAYLAIHGWKDPVQIEVGAPSLLCYVDWPLIDGNHRLAAAIVRGDTKIAASISGSVSYARELLGVRI